MPKDLIHFKVAQLTADRLSDTRFAPALTRHAPWLLLGGVFHDALFFSVSKRARPMAALADSLHGADGQDTYTLIRLQAAHAARTADDRASALLVGIISHLFADVVMHPMVWHLSGHYYADDKREQTLARQRHRALESLMDMVACPDMAGRPMFLIRRLLRSVGDELYEALPMQDLAELARVAEGDARSGLKAAFRIYAGLQALFPITPLARTLYATMPVLPAAAREIIALFYAPQLMRQASRLTNTIDYRHPVTNTPVAATLDSLMVDAADRAAALCRELEDAVHGGTPIDLPETGPSLDAGIPDQPTTGMRHFAAMPFPTFP